MGQSGCKSCVEGCFPTSWRVQQYHSQRKELENREHLNTQCAKLSDYFANRYLAGDLYDGSCYSYSKVRELLTYKYEASDGDVMVWQHALDLRAFGKEGEAVVILYHYTHELAFRNVANLKRLRASLAKRAHFGDGVYATQHEPAVWESRLQILLNNYINNGGDPLSADDTEAHRVNEAYGTGKEESGHQAAFCIPLIVPCSIAYNIFERLTPDLAETTVIDSAGQKRSVQPGEDYKGRPVHRNRDVWVIVIRVQTDGKVQDATTDGEAFLDLLQLRLLRLLRLRASAGEDLKEDCMEELAQRLYAWYGKAEELSQYEDPETLYRECLRIRRLKLGNRHPSTMTTMWNLADLLESMEKFKEAEELFREHLAACIVVHGEDHEETVGSRRNLAKFLEEIGKVDAAQELGCLAGLSAQCTVQ